MRSSRSICHRCRRLRPVTAERYCAGCTTELRAHESRVAAPPVPDAPATSPEAPTLPAPADTKPES